MFDENASWVLNAHSTKVSSLKSWLRYFRSFSEAAAKLSCLAFLLDKVYWTFTITLDFEDDLKSWFPFKNWFIQHHLNLDQKLRPNEYLDFVNPIVVDLKNICHRARASLHDVDHDIWPWRWHWIQFQKLIQTPSFELNQILNTWIF